MLYCREILVCNAAEIAAIRAGRRKSETANSQVGGTKRPHPTNAPMTAFNLLRMR